MNTNNYAKQINRTANECEVSEIIDYYGAEELATRWALAEWRAVATGNDHGEWSVVQIGDDDYVLLSAGDPMMLDRDEMAEQLGADAMAAGFGRRVATCGGDYTLVAQILDDGSCDTSLNLYVGRAPDGHLDLIASDNASMWVVGDADDAGNNHAHWSAIADHCDVDRIVIAGVREIDADLADWLAARYHEAQSVQTIGERFGNPHNPVLRWTRGDYETLHICSGLTPCDDNEEDVCSFMGVGDFCTAAGVCDEETVITDDEWAVVLRGMVSDR